jgi:hypothetical protein
MPMKNGFWTPDPVIEEDASDMDRAIRKKYFKKPAAVSA